MRRLRIMYPISPEDGHAASQESDTIEAVIRHALGSTRGREMINDLEQWRLISPEMARSAYEQLDAARAKRDSEGRQADIAAIIIIALCIGFSLWWSFFGKWPERCYGCLSPSEFEAELWGY